MQVSTEDVIAKLSELYPKELQIAAQAVHIEMLQTALTEKETEDEDG